MFSTHKMNKKIDGEPSHHDYDATLFDFRGLLRDALTLGGACYLDADVANDAGAIKALAENVSRLRGNAIDTMQSDEFQSLLTKFCVNAQQLHFGEPTYFQRTPSLRFFLPDTLGSSWHCDNWYGHPPSAYTHWLALTPVAKGAGLQFVSDPTLMARIESGFAGGQMPLSRVNTLCDQSAVEARCDVGQYLRFNARTLHGSTENKASALRLSFDFRGCPAEHGVGNKPLANYRLIDSTGELPMAAPVSASAGSRGAVKYILGNSSASTKNQHILAEGYARAHQLPIVRNEAEIESNPFQPVLNAYGSRDVPLPDSYDSVILYSVAGLPTDKSQCRAVLTAFQARGIDIHFALEDLVFPATISLDNCVKLACK